MTKFNWKLEDKEVVKDIENARELKKLSADGLNVVVELYSRQRAIPARDIAGEIDMNSYKVSKVCKKLAEDGIVDRAMRGSVYWYRLTEYGMKYCNQDLWGFDDAIKNKLLVQCMDTYNVNC